MPRKLFNPKCSGSEANNDEVNKSDKGVVRQDYILQPEAFCAKHKLPPPQKASARVVPAKDIFLKLATMAAFP